MIEVYVQVSKEYKSKISRPLFDLVFFAARTIGSDDVVMYYYCYPAYRHITESQGITRIYAE